LPQKAQEGTKTDVPILRFVVLFVAIFTFVRALVARQPRRDHRCSSVVNDFCHVRLTNATVLVEATHVAPEKPIEGLTLVDITGTGLDGAVTYVAPTPAARAP
jgi:hypothetical protein